MSRVAVEWVSKSFLKTFSSISGDVRRRTTRRIRTGLTNVEAYKTIKGLYRSHVNRNWIIVHTLNPTVAVWIGKHKVFDRLHKTFVPDKARLPLSTVLTDMGNVSIADLEFDGELTVLEPSESSDVIQSEELLTMAGQTQGDEVTSLGVMAESAGDQMHPAGEAELMVLSALENFQRASEQRVRATVDGDLKAQLSLAQEENEQLKQELSDRFDTQLDQSFSEACRLIHELGESVEKLKGAHENHIGWLRQLDTRLDSSQSRGITLKEALDDLHAQFEQSRVELKELQRDRDRQSEQLEENDRGLNATYLLLSQQGRTLDSLGNGLEQQALQLEQQTQQVADRFAGVARQQAENDEQIRLLDKCRRQQRQQLRVQLESIERSKQTYLEVQRQQHDCLFRLDEQHHELASIKHQTERQFTADEQRIGQLEAELSQLRKQLAAVRSMTLSDKCNRLMERVGSVWRSMRRHLGANRS